MPFCNGPISSSTLGSGFNDVDFLTVEACSGFRASVVAGPVVSFRAAVRSMAVLTSGLVSTAVLGWLGNKDGSCPLDSGFCDARDDNEGSRLSSDGPLDDPYK